MAKYSFTSIWKIKASREEIYPILEDVGSMTKWWSSLYIDIKRKEENDQKNISKKVNFNNKSYLPFSLNWDFKVTHVKFPSALSLKAFGDFIGTGVWKLTQLDNLTTEVRYDWNIEITKPILKYFTPILKPAIAANHKMAMCSGEESLKLEVLRRRIMNNNR